MYLKGGWVGHIILKKREIPRGIEPESPSFVYSQSHNEFSPLVLGSSLPSKHVKAIVSFICGVLNIPN
jgi:hypothetical protein